MSRTCDIAIIGGGFSGLAVLANIVRTAARPFSIIVVSRDAETVFGPAYSTPRMEHLLNVRAEGMGLFDDDHRGFYTWAAARNKNVKPHEYLPRRLFSEYLTEIRKDTLAAAKKKSIAFEFLRAEVEDIIPAEATLRIETDQGEIAARDIVLAIGNTLKAKEDNSVGARLVTDVWRYDYESLKGQTDVKNVAVVGSGLTALDSIISLLTCGWKGKITCLSGSALLPQAHPPVYDSTQIKRPERTDFIGKSLSGVLKSLRKTARGPNWPYAIDSLRPLHQELWTGFSKRDRLRLSQKYFNLWNIHRHRCAAEIRAQADEARAGGTLEMIKARCTGFRPVENGVEVALLQGGQPKAQVFDLVFKCIGVNYAVANNPLLMKLIDKGFIKAADTPYGIMANEQLRVYEGKGGTIHALGTPLFGQLFETTAVPELRHQAAKVAADVIASFAGLSRSREAGAGG